MSDIETHIVEVVKIDQIKPHPNADRLDIAVIKGWECIVQKDHYIPGQKVVYIPIDSILPLHLEERIFPPESKVKLHKSRVKTIRLRGTYSQGLVVDFATLGISQYQVGTNLKEQLGITKYEPPAPSFQDGTNNQKKASYKNPYFDKYKGIFNFKYYNTLFKPEDKVVITEKCHGTNVRFMMAPFHANNLWRKFLKLIGKAPEYVFVYGSHNVQLSEKLLYTGYYKDNVYAKAVVDYNLKNKLQPGEALYGEIYGAGIQKGYTYGCKEGERKLICFDIKKDGIFLDYDDFKNRCDEMELETVPILYKGNYNSEMIPDLVQGKSILCPEQKIREGCVIKLEKEEPSVIGRKILKCINEEYLLKDNTDYH